jgi:sugar phosphate isomerase/epimerase
MVKFGICQWSLPIEGPYCCKVAADLGLEGIELNFGKEIADEPLTKSYVRQAYLDAGKEWGIAFPSLGLNLLCQYGMSKAGDADAATAAIHAAVAVASAMDIRLLQLPSFFSGEINTQEEFQQTVKILRIACKAAKGGGMLIGTENALSANDNLRLLKEVGQENLRIYFDTQNPHAVKGLNVPEMVQALSSMIVEVHIKDGTDGAFSSALLGQGTSSFFKTAGQLKKAGFSGWILLENEYCKPPISCKNQDPIRLIEQDIITARKAFL